MLYQGVNKAPTGKASRARMHALECPNVAGGFVWGEGGTVSPLPYHSEVLRGLSTLDKNLRP